MELAKEVFSYLTFHGPTLAAILMGIVAVAETIVRLTPTKKDDAAVERVGKVIRKVIDYVGRVLPNRKAGGGEHVKQVEKEEVKKQVKEVLQKVN